MGKSKPYRLHPEAWDEIEGADQWYLERSVDASTGFITSVSDALDMISDAPERWPKYLHGTRRLVLQRFPFSIVYLVEPKIVNVVAIAHSKRRPGYWRRRI
jgi:toxin ParE1/3/4